MYRLKVIGTAIFLVFFASRSLGQNHLSLKSLLQEVHQHAPSLQADSISARIKQLQANEISYNWLPSLKLGYQADIGTNNNVPGGYFSYGIVPGNSRVRTESNPSSIFTDLGIAAFSWEIYNFGANDARRKVATSDAAIEQSKYELSKYQMDAYTIEQYLQLCRLQELRDVITLNISRNQEILRSIRALTRNGIRAGVDTSVAKAELSKTRLNYIEVQNLLMRTRLGLSMLSGLDTANMVGDTTNVTNISDFLVPISSTSQMENSYLIRPYELSLQNSHDRELLARKGFNPRISLDAAAWGRGSSVSPSDDFRSLSSGFGFERSNYLVGIGVNYNIFDLKNRQLKLRTQKAVTEYAQKQLEAQQKALALNLGNTDVDLESAIERQNEIPYQLAAATAAYRQKMSLYRNGLTDILELDATLDVLYRAETTAIDAKYQLYSVLFRKAFLNNKLEDLIASF